MRCMICGGAAAPYFGKTFGLPGLEQAGYLCCEVCGFVWSDTHARMPDADWQALNAAHHAGYQGSDNDPGDPRWRARLAAQAAVLADLRELGWVPQGRWLDYACGDGKLSALARERGVTLLNHDPYMPAGPGWLGAADLAPRGFDLVITTSVFEHLRSRAELDAIESLVAPGGVLALHTLVCEEVPRDPSWFYLVPVHCALFTNRAMAQLFRHWGYDWSVYCVAAQLWLWFRGDAAVAEARVAAANARADRPRYEFRRGFVDWWKVDPRTRQSFREKT